MKIQIKSDLHKETRSHAYKVSSPGKSIMHPDADVLVLAGDITNFTQRFSLHHELMQLRDRPVIYVPGNHEYYQADRAQTVVEELKAMYKDTNVTVLDRGWKSIMEPSGLSNVSFIGATLWTELPTPFDEYMAKVSMADFRVPGFTIDWYKDQHQASRKFIKDSLMALPSASKKIVVTHHAPSLKSTHARFKGQGLNVCFQSNLEDLMQEDGPAPLVWIHGHTHDPFDYKVGPTRVICNPKGYPGEGLQNAKVKIDGVPTLPKGAVMYNDDLIIEV